MGTIQMNDELTGGAPNGWRNGKYAHGMKGSPEWNAWRNAKFRCTNPKSPDWDDYGGRGIKMAKRWLTSFEAFYAHIGARPSALHSLDRIDNDRGYMPGNVRWATKAEQNKNRRIR